jgi:hypothetical protein
LLCILGVTGTPKFYWDGQKTSRSGIQLLHISNNDYQDVAHLTISRFASGQNDCLFEGSFKHDPDAIIVVSGCPGSSKFQVKILSEQLEDTVFVINNQSVTALRHTVLEKYATSYKKTNDVNKNIKLHRLPSSGFQYFNFTITVQCTPKNSF